METEKIRRKINSALDFEDWQIRNEYKSVSVLALYWEQADHPGFQQEARSLGALFSKRFHYDVDYFPIPSANSHVELDTRINLLLKQRGHLDHLLIIYYGGHGDPNNDIGDEKLAVWAAQARGGPDVKWSIIQPKFAEVKAEVLLLLDCCFAAQAARANQNRAIPSNVELFAACAMGVKTILPGPHSFTTYLIKFLEDSLSTSSSVKISDLAILIASRKSGYKNTPQHFSGLGGGKSTICLEPFNANPITDITTKHEAAWLTLTVSLRDVLTEPLIMDIIQWLKAHPKRKVSRLTVENVVLSADRVRHFIHDEGKEETRGPKFNQLAPLAKQDVLIAWTKFQSLLALLAMQLKSSSLSLSQDGDSNMNENIIDHTSPAPPSPLATLLDLETSLLSLQNVVQRSVMAIPDLYENREALLSAIEDTAMQDLGFIPLLSRRIKARFPSDLDSIKTEHKPEATPDLPTKFRSLVKEQLEGFESVLVEYKYYEEMKTQPLNLDRFERQVQILASLLQTSDLHMLRCLRWFHEPWHKRFGLVFEYPTGYIDVISLRELIENTRFSQRPSLGQRFQIAREIGETILKWHTSADWVHQGISSHNIYFFRKTDSDMFDYSNPFLCGFEFSRPSSGPSLNAVVEEFELNVYRHPTRQGAPSEYHTKRHDVYSYGIFLLELGIWNLVGNCFSEKMKKNLSPSKMQEYILLNARQRLKQCMGAAYERATTRCLAMELGVELDDSVGSVLAKAFEELVLQEIEPGTRLD
ncbi:MAG: hypothetical protein Q9167_001223 [Letrouitia subvulpina]